MDRTVRILIEELEKQKKENSIWISDTKSAVFAFCPDYIYIYTSMLHFEREHKECVPTLIIDAVIEEDYDEKSKKNVYENAKKVLSLLNNLFDNVYIDFIYDVIFKVYVGNIQFDIGEEHGKLYVVSAFKSIKGENAAKYFSQVSQKLVKLFTMRMNDVLVKIKKYEIVVEERDDYIVSAEIYIYVVPHLSEIIKIFDK